MSRIIAYYECLGADGAGRTLDDVLSRDDEFIEDSHDFIQFLFPLPEPSAFAPDAPLLTPEDIARFKSDPFLPDRVRLALRRMRMFYERTTAWRRAHDHNHLRITRILRFLTLVGLTAEAEEFHAWLIGVAMGDGEISMNTAWYWVEALNDNPAWLEAP